MPVDRGALDVQLREIGEGERWWDHREFRELPHILRADEKILGLVRGKLLGPLRPRVLPRSPWLIVATDQRLLCLKQERFARKQIDIAPGQITRILQRNRLRAFQITIDLPTQRYRIRIARSDAFRFAGALARLVPEPEAQGTASRLPSAPGIAGLISSGFSAVAGHASAGDVERLKATVEQLQHDVDRLQQQVGFLEDLLMKRGEEATLAHFPANR